MVHILEGSSPSFYESTIWTNFPPHLQTCHEVPPWGCHPHATWTNHPFSHLKISVSSLPTSFMLLESLVAAVNKSPPKPPLLKPSRAATSPGARSVLCSQVEGAIKGLWITPSLFPTAAETAAPNLLKPTLWSQYLPGIWEELWVLILPC